MVSTTTMHQAWFVGLVGALMVACGGQDAPSGSSGGAGGGGGAIRCGAEPSSDDANFAELIALTEQWLEQANVSGAALAVHRLGSEPQIATFGVRDAGSCDPVTEQTLIRQFSPAFWSTQLAALAAVEQGKMSLDERVGGAGAGSPDLVPSFDVVSPNPHGDRTAIALLDLLHDSSGLPGGFSAEVGGTRIGSACESDGTLTGFFEARSNLQLTYPPGRHWDYSDIGRQLLGLFVESATGMPFSQAVQELVFDPLDIAPSYDRDVIEAADHMTDLPFAACAAEQPAHGLFMNIRDKLALLEAVLPGGGLVTDATWDAVYGQPHPTPSSPPPAGARSNAIVVDGAAVWILGHCDLVVPDHDFVVTMLVPSEDGKAGYPEAICERALELYLGLTVSPIESALPTASWTEYEGDYLDTVSNPPRSLSVSLDNGALVAHLNGIQVGLAPSTYWSWMTDGALARSHEADVFTSSLVKWLRFWRDPATGQVDSVGGFFGGAEAHFFRVQP